MFFNKTYDVKMNLANGYWTNFHMNFDYVNRTFTFALNRTFTETIPILNDFSVAPNIDREIFTYELLFSFYFNVQLTLGGFELSKIPALLKELDRSYIQPSTRETFKPLFTQFLALGRKIFWSGCLKNVKVNGFQVKWSTFFFFHLVIFQRL